MTATRQETGYKPWFAWHPVRIKDRWVWWKKVLKNTIWYHNIECPLIISLYKDFYES